MYRYGTLSLSLLLASIVAIALIVGGTHAAQASPLGEEFVLRDDISEYWDQGYRITDVAYGDGLWAVVMTEDTGYGRQAWMYSADFPAEFIREKWDEGLDLTTLTYGDGWWMVVMTGGLDWVQTFRRGTFEEIVDHIDKYPDYMISEVAYGEGVWAAVMSLGENDNAQYWHLSSEWPVDAVSGHWDLGYSITDVTYGESQWLVVMTYDAGYAGDLVRRRVDWPADDIDQDYADVPEGSVVTLDYGDGVWAYTFAVTDWSGGQVVLADWAPEEPTPTATPVPTSMPTTAPTPSPTLAPLFSIFTEILVEEIRTLSPDVAYDFESDSGGWDLDYDDEYETYLQGGAYHVAVDVADVVAWGYSEDEAYDFYAEVEVTSLTGTEDAEAGMAFRCTETDVCYFFLLHPDATYSLQTYVDGAWQFIVERTESDAIEIGEGATNRLGVLTDIDQISLFVNDVLLTEVWDDSVSGTRFGLVASSFTEAGVEFAFDNFSLWSLDLEVPLTATSEPTLAPTVLEATPTPLPASTPEPTAVPDVGSDADSRADVVRRVEAIVESEPSYRNSFTPDVRWDVYSDAETVRYYINETLRMRVIPEQYTDWTYLELKPSDFYLEFDVIYREAPGHAGAGVIFRMNSSLNYYRYAISPEDTYSLIKRVDDEWEFLTEWTASDSIQTADRAVNRLGLLAEGDQIALFANGKLLTVVEDDSHVAGDTALALVTYEEGNVEVQFDNVVMWELDGDAPDTDTPDTDVPDTDAPDTDEPDTDEPDKDAPSLRLPLPAGK